MLNWPDENFFMTATFPGDLLFNEDARRELYILACEYYKAGWDDAARMITEKAEDVANMYFPDEELVIDE